MSELRARRDTVRLEAEVGERPSFDGPADFAQRREQLRELLDDVHRLPRDQRAALVLFELGGHSHAEIAEVLGVRREKVKALIFQAREALMRSRQARNSPCTEIRARLACARGRIMPRGLARAHIERCPACAAFEAEVQRQRGALALILPVVAPTELKASVLSSIVTAGGAGAAASGAGATGGGAAALGSASSAGGGIAAGAPTTCA